MVVTVGIVKRNAQRESCVASADVNLSVSKTARVFTWGIIFLLWGWPDKSPRKSGSSRTIDDNCQGFRPELHQVCLPISVSGNTRLHLRSLARIYLMPGVAVWSFSIYSHMRTAIEMMRNMVTSTHLKPAISWFPNSEWSFDYVSVCDFSKRQCYGTMERGWRRRWLNIPSTLQPDVIDWARKIAQD